jgi:peptidyl-prolyl cis-trans isomerase A (cyclophilin A)
VRVKFPKFALNSWSGVCLLSALLASSLQLAAENPKVTMKTTLGDIVLELDAEKAPISTYNFLKYAESGYYEGTIFHRVIPTFMIQGGGMDAEMDKKTKGLMPPIKNEWKNGLKNKRGTIAMARTSAPDSATSQFFINVVDNATLDVPRGGAAYAVFGKVVEGMETVDKIRDTETRVHPKYNGNKVVPVTPVVIESVKVNGEYDLAKLEQAMKTVTKRETNQVSDPIEKEAAFLAENAKKENVKETASGLQYTIEREGDGTKPSPTDTVEFHYSGKFLDGTEFDSSYKRNAPTSFPLNGVIPAWTEGLQLIGKGGKIKLFVPSKLGYGARGFPGAIPPYSTLVFDVELLDIK